MPTERDIDRLINLEPSTFAPIFSEWTTMTSWTGAPSNEHTDTHSPEEDGDEEDGERGTLTYARSYARITPDDMPRPTGHGQPRRAESLDIYKQNLAYFEGWVADIASRATPLPENEVSHHIENWTARSIDGVLVTTKGRARYSYHVGGRALDLSPDNALSDADYLSLTLVACPYVKAWFEHIINSPKTV